jgi:hypothetical protein
MCPLQTHMRLEGITGRLSIIVCHGGRVAFNEGVGEVNLALRFLVGSCQVCGVEVARVYTDMLFRSVGVDADGIDSVGLSLGDFESSVNG